MAQADLSKEIRHTVCNRDCPDACRIAATVENGRVTRLAGDKNHPVTQGFLCYRTNRFLERQYSPERLTRPLLKKDGRLQPVGWDEALDHAASELTKIRSESGPAAIFHYRSGGSLGLLKSLTDYFFALFGPVTVKRGDICSGAGEAAQILDFGISESNDLFDLENARNILLWGKNVFVSSPHTLPVLKRAQEKGARLTLIDPVHHRTATLCDRFIQPRPGGDLALAMAVAQTLFERNWVDPQARDYCDHFDAFRALSYSKSLERWCSEADVGTGAAHDLAEQLGPGKPCTILVGWGMGRRKNGGAIVRALDALGAISGNLGIAGGGVSFYFRRRGAFSLPSGPLPPRTVCEPLFGPDVLNMKDPPIRAIWVTAGNPVVMLPESQTTVRALQSRDFVVVVDSFLTDTARLADLVLPTTTLLEDDDVLGAYGHHFLGASRPVVDAPPEVKTDLQIVQGLAERVGLGPELAGTARQWKERAMGPVHARGLTLEALEQGAVRNPLPSKVLFADRKFQTSSGRVQLMAAEPLGPARPTPEFPLLLASLSTDRAQSSQWAKKPARPVVTVHPDSAAGVGDGGTARLESRLGSLEVVVAHDPKQRTDVALIPKGGHLADGQCANAITAAVLTDLGEGGALYDEPVRIAPARA